MKVLIIEDSAEVVEVVRLCFDLRWPGTETIATSMGAKGIEAVERESPNVVILDLGLPDMSGFDVLKEIRLFSDVPILILTVRDDEVAKVKGLELGADDYIVKPFSHLELLARVKVVLRRSQMPQLKGGEKPVILGDVVVDFSGRQVTRAGENVSLTPTEWKMLIELVRNSGKVLTYETLLRRVWGDEFIDSTDHIKKYVHRLRQKLGDDPSAPRFIANEQGVGYRFVDDAH